MSERSLTAHFVSAHHRTPSAHARCYIEGAQPRTTDTLPVTIASFSLPGKLRQLERPLPRHEVHPVWEELETALLKAFLAGAASDTATDLVSFILEETLQKERVLGFMILLRETEFENDLKAALNTAFSKGRLANASESEEV